MHDRSHELDVTYLRAVGMKTPIRGSIVLHDTTQPRLVFVYALRPSNAALEWGSNRCWLLVVVVEGTMQCRGSRNTILHVSSSLISMCHINSAVVERCAIAEEIITHTPPGE